MKITIKAFNRKKHFDIAVDEDNETYLIGIPFNYGPAEHTNFYVVSKAEFESGLSNPNNLDHLVEGQNFLGNGRFYHSTFRG